MDPSVGNAIRKLNEELGSDMSNLQKCREIEARLKQEKDSIEQMLSLASNEVPSRVTAAVQQVEQISEEISLLTEQLTNLQKESAQPLESGDAIIAKLQNLLDNIQSLERTKIYLERLRAVEDLSNELECNLSERAEARCVSLFQQLRKMNEDVQGSQCSHLLAFMRETLLFWHTVLKKRFSVEFDEVLQAIRWPFVSSNSVLSSPTDQMPRFQALIEYLLLLQLLDQQPVVDSTLLTDVPPISPPLQLLLRPLRRRFVYHFCRTDKETSRPDKPEWCFTQVLAWIRDHHQFVEQWVQPVMDRLSMNISARTEFIRGLVQLVASKLHAELPSLQYDDALFSHAVDETLSLARELRDGYSYTENTLLAVLTQASLFSRWLHLEKKFAFEKMDSILSSETAWQPLGTSEVDELKVTECVDSFLSLLLAITERYSCLPQPGHKLQFLDLQLELVDDWRVRLLQLLHEEFDDPLNPSSRTPAILNSVHYLTIVLSEWSNNVHFLNLHYFRSKLLSASSSKTDEENLGTVFDESVSLLDRMKTDLLSSICETVMMDVQARSRPYRKDNWHAMPSPAEFVSAGLTPSGCSMFRVLSAHLLKLEQLLAVSLFRLAWNHIANSLCQFIYEEVIRQNCFSEGGALQLQFDMFRNLFPLFGQFTEHPEMYFPQVKEACVLLNMVRGSAMLLQETLDSCELVDEDEREVKCNNKSSRDVLEELDIHRLTGAEALTVLQLRKDLISKT